MLVIMLRLMGLWGSAALLLNLATYGLLCALSLSGAHGRPQSGFDEQHGRILIGSPRVKANPVVINDSGSENSNDWSNSDAGYQSDSATALTSLWGKRHVIRCGENNATIWIRGRGLSHLLLDQGGSGPVPVTKLQRDCGFSFKRTKRATKMVAPYEGCYLKQEDGAYILPLYFMGQPNPISCPEPATTDAPTAAPFPYFPFYPFPFPPFGYPQPHHPTPAPHHPAPPPFPFPFPFFPPFYNPFTPAAPKTHAPRQHPPNPFPFFPYYWMPFITERPPTTKAPAPHRYELFPGYYFVGQAAKAMGK